MPQQIKSKLRDAMREACLCINGRSISITTVSKQFVLFQGESCKLFDKHLNKFYNVLLRAFDKE